jgi:hypothetical protein
MGKRIPIFVNSNFGVNTSNNGSSVSYHINPPLEIGTNKVTFRVLTSSIWWVIPNISPELNNNTLRILDGATPFVITFEKGLYDLTSLNENLGQALVNLSYPSNTIIFTGDNSTSKVSVQVNSIFFSIDWPNSTIKSLLGFNTNPATPTGLSGAFYEGNEIANLNTVNSILIRSNFTTGVYYNDKTGSNIIASISPNVPIGSQILFNPRHPIESVVNVHHIDEINIYLTDENGRYLDTNGENFSVLGEFIFED